MIKNWEKQLENDEKVGIFFVDPSKAFDTINHSLLLAKLKAHDFPNQALNYYKICFAADFREAQLTVLLVAEMR